MIHPLKITILMHKFNMNFIYWHTVQYIESKRPKLHDTYCKVKNNKKSTQIRQRLRKGAQNVKRGLRTGSQRLQ